MGWWAVIQLLLMPFYVYVLLMAGVARLPWDVGLSLFVSLVFVKTWVVVPLAAVLAILQPLILAGLRVFRAALESRHG